MHSKYGSSTAVWDQIQFTDSPDQLDIALDLDCSVDQGLNFASELRCCCFHIFDRSWLGTALLPRVYYLYLTEGKTTIHYFCSEFRESIVCQLRLLAFCDWIMPINCGFVHHLVSHVLKCQLAVHFVPIPFQWVML